MHDAHHGAHGAHLGVLHGAWPHHVVPGGIRIKPGPSLLSRGGGLRVPKPELSSPPRGGGFRVPKPEPEQESDLSPPLVEYTHLQAEDGNPEDKPGLLRALHKLEAYQPYQPPPRHPNDPADQSGITFALRNSVADVAIDVDWLYNSDNDEDDDE